MAGRRTLARQSALQALYQWQMTGQTPAEIERQFLDDPEAGDFERSLFHELLHGVPAHLGELDASLGPLLDRPVEQVDPVERAILRLGAYELLRSPELPYRVVINEAVDLAKRFGAEQGHRYVNGVLDKLARRARAAEM
jgi:N utilization substance protein B